MDLDALLKATGPVTDSLKQTDADRASSIFEGRAGGGAVTVKVNGLLAVQKVTIAPAAAVAADGDVGMLEDLVAAAITDALRLYRQRYGATAEEQMQKLMAGADLGSLMKIFSGGR
jgi:nucleoid-associated protein EbfC